MLPEPTLSKLSSVKVSVLCVFCHHGYHFVTTKNFLKKPCVGSYMCEHSPNQCHCFYLHIFLHIFETRECINFIQPIFAMVSEK